MTQIPRNPDTEISPIEFEKLIHDYLSNIGKKLKSFKAIHNLKIKKSDGNYQIDVYAEFEAFGGVIKVLLNVKDIKIR